MDIKEKIQEIINHRKGLGTYVGKGHLDEVKKKKDFFIKLIHSVEKFKNFREVALQQITDQTGEYYIMSSENPISSILSASSRMKNETLLKSTLPRLMWEISRPGVAIIMSAPSCKLFIS